MIYDLLKNKINSAIQNKINEALGDIGINRGVARTSSITEFQSMLSKGNGLARGNKYEIEILAPAKHPGGTDTRMINLQCSSIAMPGHNLEQHTQRFGSEPAQEIVTSHSYAGNISATFYLDEALNTKAWFDKWQEMTYNPETHKAQYYNDYIGEMNIYQLGGDGRTYGVKCEEVYPATIAPIEYSYESTDVLAILNVEFAYRRWTEIKDVMSGVPYDKSGQLIGTSTEKLPGNGVISYDRPFDTSRIFK